MSLFHMKSVKVIKKFFHIPLLSKALSYRALKQKCIFKKNVAIVDMRQLSRESRKSKARWIHLCVKNWNCLFPQRREKQWIAFSPERNIFISLTRCNRQIVSVNAPDKSTDAKINAFVSNSELNWDSSIGEIELLKCARWYKLSHISFLLSSN